MHLQHNKHVYSMYDRDEFYDLIFSKDTKKLTVTAAKSKCNICSYMDNCGCIVYHDCDEGREYYTYELRIMEAIDIYEKEKLSEMGWYEFNGCIDCDDCDQHCLY